MKGRELVSLIERHGLENVDIKIVSGYKRSFTFLEISDVAFRQCKEENLVLVVAEENGIKINRPVFKDDSLTLL